MMKLKSYKYPKMPHEAITRYNLLLGQVRTKPVITNHTLLIEVSSGRSKIGPLLGEGFEAK